MRIGYVEISNQKYHKNGFASHVDLQMTNYPTTLFHNFGLCEDLHSKRSRVVQSYSQPEKQDWVQYLSVDKIACGMTHDKEFFLILNRLTGIAG